MKEFSIPFKEQAYKTFEYHKDHGKIMTAIKDNKHNIVRNIIEDSLDDPELNIDEEVIDDGSRIVINAKIRAKKRRQNLYNDFMKNYVL